MVTRPISPTRDWLLKVAWQYTTDREKVYDLAQEGSIAAWRAEREWTEAKGCTKGAYIHMSAKYRIMKCAQRETWLGRESMSGHIRPPEQPMPIDAEDVLTLSDDIDDLIMAYHHGEIMDALAALTPKQRDNVIRRFWRDEVVKGGGWWEGPSGAKAKLAIQLDHLKELV